MSITPTIFKSKDAATPAAVQNLAAQLDTVSNKVWAENLASVLNAAGTAVVVLKVGTAGTPADTVLSVQGVGGGQPLVTAGTSQPADPAATTGTITAADADSTTGGGAGGQVLVTGAATANSAVSTGALSGVGSAVVTLSGTYSATLVFEASPDGGATWVRTPGTPVGADAGSGTSAGNGVYRVSSPGSTHYRVRCTTFTSGTVSVRVQPTAQVPAGVDAGLLVYSPAIAGNVRLRQPDVFVDLDGVSIGSIATVWTPAGGKKVRLMGGSISVSDDTYVLFEDDESAGGFVFRTPSLVADSPYNFDLPGGRLLSAADHVLKATAGVTATITGTLWGTEE